MFVNHDLNFETTYEYRHWLKSGKISLVHRGGPALLRLVEVYFQNFNTVQNHARF